MLRLVAAGHLGLDQPVRDFLEADLPLVAATVTVRHLLEHTSGIGDYLDETQTDDLNDYVLDVPVHTLDRTSGFLPLLAGRAQVSAPGELFAYNNGGFVLLALLAERATGRDFHQLVDTEVIGPAGMQATAYLRSDDLPGEAALGYLDAGGNRSNLLHLPVRGNGDGGCYSTVDDLHRFWLALMDGRLLDSPSLATMIEPRHDVPSEGLRYGMGLWLHPWRPVLVMEGCDAGVSMRSVHDPATGITATVLAKTADGAWPVAELLLRGFDDQP